MQRRQNNFLLFRKHIIQYKSSERILVIEFFSVSLWRQQLLIDGACARHQALYSLRTACRPPPPQTRSAHDHDSLTGFWRNNKYAKIPRASLIFDLTYDMLSVQIRDGCRSGILISDKQHILRGRAGCFCC